MLKKNGKFSKEDGGNIPRDDWHNSYIYELTLEKIHKIEQYNISCRLAKVNWSELSLDTLRKIDELL